MRIIPAIMVVAASLFAQLPVEQTTGGAPNCRFWNASTHDQQVGFVVGYFDAWQVIGTDTTLKSADYVPADATFGEMAKGINATCSAPENARIPIHWALTFFTAKRNGMSEAKLTALIESFRKLSAQTSSKP
jgi:hypothetical protein